MPHPCPSCAAPVEQAHDVGRPRVYCSDACRYDAARRRRMTRHAEAINRAAAMLASLRAASANLPAD